MKILAINSGIGSSAGIFDNGKAVVCFEEERFNRVKNWMGFPEMALQKLLESYVNKDEIDEIVLTNESPYVISRDSFYGVYDKEFENAKTLRFGSGKLKHKAKQIIKNAPFYNSSENSLDIDVDRLTKLGFNSKDIYRYNHHDSHAAAVYYGLAKRLDESYLIFTLDGGGDGITSSVYLGKNGEINRKSESNCFSIGNMYSTLTYFLGFTPHEHEYKLMGLAPYVKPKYATKYKEYFAEFLDLKNDDTEFYNPNPLDRTLFLAQLMEDFNRDRFDNMAAGLQLFTEEIVLRWIKGNIKKYGIKNVLGAGGVFMNVKLNMLLSQINDVDYVNIFPSCGDETNIFGAAYMHHNSKSKKEVGLLDSFTLGTDIAKEELDRSIQRVSSQINVKELNTPNTFIAQQLGENKIVARCCGKMEFGARALGNRSIMANPSSLKNVAKINQAVKNRDFWMPFAPAVLHEKCNDLVDIPRSLSEKGSPYMMFAFDTIPGKEENIICGVHQADNTARVEMVSRDLYPDFHEVITEFDKITGIPCVLNTSFNLHGFPIVENAEQALHVLLNSKIDVLVIDRFAITRK